MRRDGSAEGEFRADLDGDSGADLIQQLHVDYSTRAYRREPEFPVVEPLIEAVCHFVQAAVADRR